MTGLRSPVRWIPLILGVLLMAAACTRTTDSTTTTTDAPGVTTTMPTVGPAPSATEDPYLSEPIPVDPAVHMGVLDNGLTYFIRYNDSPGGRAELRLAVNAGSVLEDDDQLGGAHFLEHMMFNGTERFPRNELTAVLESFGPRFGPDINAYTNFDETVYQLGLPTDDADLLELGIDVLVEWASRATITEAEVIAERGVVLEEWRLRDQGAQGRIGSLLNELVVAGSAYADRIPIGTAESIEATTDAALARFYADWYRPDLMAVVAVGDFDVDQVERWIIDRFGDLPAAESPRPRTSAGFVPPEEPRVGSLADPESPSAFAQVMWLGHSSRPATIGDLRDALLRSLALSMFAERFEMDVARGEAPFFNVTGLDFGYTRAFGVTGIAVDAVPAMLSESVTMVLAEAGRINAHGFDVGELDRMLSEVLTGAEQARQSQNTAQDGQFADELVDHFLAGSPIPSADDRYSILVDLIDNITLADVEGAFTEATIGSAPLTLVVGPADSDVPSEAEVATAVADGLVAELGPRETDSDHLGQLMDRPEPARIISRDIDPDYGFVTVEFENGAIAKFWQTEIADNSFVLSAESPGGTSLLPIDDLPEAYLITDIVTRSGVGLADQIELERLLADQFAGVDPYIDEVSEGFFGGAASGDAETLLQLVHLYMTEPRADAAAIAAVLSEERPFAENPDDIPDLIVTMALIDAYYSGDPRYFAVPSPEQLDTFDADRALALYRERFGNAADFTFVFVGDFELEELIDLTASYIGTLPATGDAESFVDHQPLPPRRVQLRELQAGQDPQGRLLMAFTAELVSDAFDRVTADVLTQILNTRLRDRIREELAASYSPFAGIDLQQQPDPFIESFIEVSGDPERLAEISSAVLAELADLRTAGPTASQLATAQEQVRRQYELFNNPQLAAALLFVERHPAESVTELSDRLTLVDEVDAEAVRRLAIVAFPAEARIEIRLTPAA